MKKISLALPTYNTSQYFDDCIKYALDDDFIDEIVVNDDCSSPEHFQTFKSKIENINSKKIKLFSNTKNVGAFRNKYQTVKNCSNEWVYLLDSDNYPFEESYQLMRGIPDSDPNIFYSPQHLCCKHDGANDFEVVSDYNFGYDLIGIEESKKCILGNIEWFGWLVNSGNYIVNKDRYTEVLKEPYENVETPLLHADTAAVFYYWLKSGGKVKIVEGLRHNHRLRSDSNWHSCGNNSQASVNYYETAIKEL